MIFVYNTHSIKAWFLIEVTEEGIDICVSDEQDSKAHFPIEVTEEGSSKFTFFNYYNP